jgi:4-hydroxybenzoate polyprenyltransferase
MSLSAFFRLIRITNLFIILMLFVILHHWYVNKFYPSFNPEHLNVPVFPFTTILFLAIAVILIAAAGYIINDYFDIRTDMVNRPESMIAGKYFSRKSLIYFNLLLNISGITFGFIASYKSGHLSLGIIYPMASALLIFYSTHLKKYPWLGNITVALLIGFLPILYYLHLISFIHIHISFIQKEQILILGKLFKFLMLYGLFAFLLNIIREIIKDMEDVEGDKEIGAQTIPIKYGLDSTKIFVFLINLILSLLIAFVIYNTIKNAPRVQTTFMIFLVLNFLFSLLNGYFILKAKNKNDFHKISIWLKVFMFFGLLMPLFVQIN